MYNKLSFQIVLYLQCSFQSKKFFVFMPIYLGKIGKIIPNQMEDKKIYTCAKIYQM